MIRMEIPVKAVTAKTRRPTIRAVTRMVILRDPVAVKMLRTQKTSSRVSSKISRTRPTSSVLMMFQTTYHMTTIMMVTGGNQ